MGRPKGSLNKPKPVGTAIRLEKQIEGAPVCRPTVQGWVKYGVNNDYPKLLLDLYEQSTTHQACIDFAAASIVGEGVDYEAMNIDGTQTQPSYDTTWDDFIKAISLDFAIFRSFAVEIIMNNDGRTYSFYHVPFDKVRATPYDKDGVITAYYVCNDWTNTVQNPPRLMRAFGMQDDDVIVKGESYLYVYTTYSPTQTYYSSPKYVSGIKAIQSEIEFINYDLRHAANNFTPIGVLTINQVADDAERAAVMKSLKDMFTGSENAGNLMVNFRTNPEDKGAEFSPFTAPTQNVNLFEAANERTITRILSAHQIPSRLLIGIPQGNNGFNSESAMLETAYKLYNKLVGNNNRLCITKTLNHMLRMNGIDVEIVLKPLTFLDVSETGDRNPMDETNEKVVTDETKTGNIEERKS